MTEYTYLIRYGIVKNAKQWDDVVKNNSKEKIELFVFDNIDVNNFLRKEFVARLQLNQPIKEATKDIDCILEKDLNVLAKILSHFIGYEPNLDRYKVKLSI